MIGTGTILCYAQPKLWSTEALANMMFPVNRRNGEILNFTARDVTLPYFSMEQGRVET